MLNPDTFRREMARLRLALDASPQQPDPTAERLVQLYEDVKHLDEYSFSLACDRCRRELEWFPKAKHILERAEVIQRASGALTDGEAAWGAFEQRVLSRYSFGVTKQHDWPDDDTRDIVRNHLGLPLGGVHQLATMENAYERDKYHKLFVKLYNERQGTMQAVERAEAQLDAPNMRRLDSGQREAGD